MPNLHKLFSPKSVAIVGVSSDAHKLGSVIMQNILAAGFSGPVYPVNPKYEAIAGLKCYPKVSKIKQDIDLVVVAVPAEYVVDVIKDCGKKNVEYAVVISAGFSEAGQAGAKLELQLRQAAREAGVRILGPNCLGLTVSESKLNASFAALEPQPGKIAFLSQSGAFNSAMLDLAAVRNLGFSHFVSIGNKVDINELEILAEWLKDDSIDVIGLYLEQFSDGKDLLDLIKQYPNKPVVVLHPGESKAAQAAMSLHTGALAGSSQVVKSGLAQAGVVQVDSLENLFNAMWLLSLGKVTHHGRVAIVTNAGGPAIMLADLLAKKGLSMAHLEETTLKRLAHILPRTVVAHNPVDLVGDALASRYAQALEAVVADANVDAILVVVTPQLVTQIEATAQAIIAFSKQTSKLIVPLFIGGLFVQPAITRFDQAGLPSFIFPEQAVGALAAIQSYHYHHKQKHLLPSKIYANTGKHLAAVNKLTKSTPTTLPQQLTYELAAEVGITLPDQRIVHSFDQVLSFVAEHGFPLVLKLLAEDLIHKTDLKAVITGIDSIDKLKSAYEHLEWVVTEKLGSGMGNGFLIQKQLPANEELFLGATRDGDAEVYTHGKGFGHLVVFGKGGIYTEIYQDTATALVPFSKQIAESLIARTKMAKILEGTRGRAALSKQVIVDTIIKLQRLVQMYPQISLVDMNPLLVTQHGCYAVDIKLVVQS